MKTDVAEHTSLGRARARLMWSQCPLLALQGWVSISSTVLLSEEKGDMAGSGHRDLCAAQLSRGRGCIWGFGLPKLGCLPPAKPSIKTCERANVNLKWLQPLHLRGLCCVHPGYDAAEGMESLGPNPLLEVK